MKSILKRIGISALFGFLTVLSFALLELFNRREFHEEFPFSLFLGMWVLQVVFFFAFLSVMQKIRTAENNRFRLVGYLLGIIILVLAAWFWTSVLIDQMPCFLGIRYCD